MSHRDVVNALRDDVVNAAKEWIDAHDKSHHEHGDAELDLMHRTLCLQEAEARTCPDCGGRGEWSRYWDGLAAEPCQNTRCVDGALKED